MNQGSFQHLQKARQLAHLAHRLLRHAFVNDAARDAYLAAYHAAQAFIIDRTGEAAPTHWAAHVRFGDLAGAEPRIEEGMKAFLAASYRLKTAIDDDAASTGDLHPQDAQNAVHGAEAFVKLVGSLLTHPPNPQRERSDAPMS